MGTPPGKCQLLTVIQMSRLKGKEDKGKAAAPATFQLFTERLDFTVL